MTGIPIACALEGGALRARWQRWGTLVRTSQVARRSVPGGLELRFTAAALRELEELVAAERACCAWATWELAVDDGRPVLTATAPEEPGPEALRSFFEV